MSLSKWLAKCLAKSLGLALVLICTASLLPRNSSAAVLDVDTFGLSIHLGGSYSGAPLGLDSHGVYVYNPGLGLGFDSRATAATSGFSLVAKAGGFGDCNLVPLFYATAGVRYAYFFSGEFSLGASVSAGLMNGEDWNTGIRSFSFMPLPIFEMSKRVFKQDAIRLGTVYAPNNSAMSATSGGGLLFLMLSYSHSF